MTHNERVLSLLADGEWHTHHELYALHVIAHSRISELRRRGHLIEIRRDGDLYLYRLVSRPTELPARPRGAAVTGEHGNRRLADQPSLSRAKEQRLSHGLCSRSDGEPDGLFPSPWPVDSLQTHAIESSPSEQLALEIAA